MKCRILFVALSSMLSLSHAVSVDYYPQNHHAQPQVNYIEPAHVKAVKYVQPAPVAPVYNHVAAAPIKYVHQEPHAVKYVESPQYVKQVEYEQPAQYEYGYDVNDPHTGDVKSHTEKRNGNAVSGRYEVLDPDGFKRIVEYTADEHNGFNAVVRREPIDVKLIKKVYEPEVVKHVAPIAPAIKYYSPQPQLQQQAFVAPQPQLQQHAFVAPQPQFQQQAFIAPAQKLFTPSVHQKVIAPVVKQYVSPQQYYAPPENPKFFAKPVQRIAKIVKPSYDYEPHQQHTAVKYVNSQPHYNQY